MTPAIVVCIAVAVAIVVFVAIMFVGFALARRHKEE
jgi:preprotein translocase subunit Sec61beta